MVPLPTNAQPVVGPGGIATPAFYRFFGALSRELDGSSTGWVAAIDAVNARVDTLSDGFKVRGVNSILSGGSVASGLVTVALVNDAPSPGNTYFYGTGTTGIKGWHALSSALSHTSNITLTTGTDGVTTIDVADLADSGIGSALVKITRDGKGRVSGTHSATTSDLTEGTNLYYTDTRADARINLQKAAANGLATLGSDGKLDASQIPALAITETFVVASQLAMLSLTAQEGDVAVRTDLNKTFILTTSPATTLANWQELLTPTGAVSSFNGRTGAIIPANGDYTAAQVGAEPSITAGTITQYWRGDKSWQILDKTAVGLSNVDNTSDANKPVSTATQTALDALIPAGYIDGLQLVWVSATALTVKSGAAYVQSLGKVLKASSDIAKTGLSLSATTVYHVYYFSNAGTPDVEISTTAPATAYNGTARSKTSDTSRRYIGSILTDGSGNIISFVHSRTQGRIDYRTAIGGSTNPLQVLNNGRATTGTNVSCSAVVPSTATHMVAFLFNDSTTAQTVVFAASDGPTLTSANWEGFCASGSQAMGTIRLDSSQRFSYAYLASPSGVAGFTVRVSGYCFER